MRKIKNPEVLKNILTEEQKKELVDYFYNLAKDAPINDKESHRFTIGDEDPILQKYTKIIMPFAKQFFESDTLVPSYTLFSHYKGKAANLRKHMDANACTYTVDLCIYCYTDWDLWIENIPYKFLPGDAIAFYGEDQIHWRESFPDPENNHYGAIFFHYVEPDHWWFTDRENGRKKRLEELSPLVEQWNQ